MNSNFAIGVLSFNHPEITGRCLRSLEPHSGVAVYLLHNGSRSDCTQRLMGEFPAVQHLHLDTNQGFAGGASHLISKILARHEWVLFLSNDCELVSSQISPPEKSGLFAARVYRRKTGQVDSLGGRIESSQFRLKHCRSESDFHSSSDLRYIPGSSFWIDRESWTKAGPFEPSLICYWEDVLLSLRAQRKGVHLGLHPSTEVEHSIGKTCGKDAYYTTYLFQRNRAWVLRTQLHGTKKFWPLLFFHLDLAKLFLNCLRTRNWTRLSLVVRAYGDGLFAKIAFS